MISDLFPHMMAAMIERLGVRACVVRTRQSAMLIARKIITECFKQSNRLLECLLSTWSRCISTFVVVIFLTGVKLTG